MRLAAGEQVRTGCGRLTSPFPTVLANGRWRGSKGHPGLTGALRMVENWLLENAMAVAVARGNDFARRQFELALASKQITQADRDSAEHYLCTPLPGEALAQPAPPSNTATS